MKLLCRLIGCKPRLIIDYPAVFGDPRFRIFKCTRCGRDWMEFPDD